MRPKKKCFVLMPFRQPYDTYYTEIFKPALESAGYTVQRADDVFTPGPIMLDIQESIANADLILCVMNERSPNVFYELGLAHGVGNRFEFAGGIDAGDGGFGCGDERSVRFPLEFVFVIDSRSPHFLDTRGELE